MYDARVKDFRGKIAVITGAGTGMGRELALQLAAEGSHLALCDVFPDTLAQTEADCRKLAPPDTLVTGLPCDVSDEQQVLRFRDAALREHGSGHINLLFNNAGIGGGLSFIKDARAVWEKTFGVCWFGVYYCTRAFMPALLASSEGCLVNVSSVNAFYTVTPDGPHTAYSTAKAAVKGFTEALYTDLRINAPHVKVALVMPGHVGTSIVPNTMRSYGFRSVSSLTDAELTPVRMWLATLGVDAAALAPAQVRALAEQHVNTFRDTAPMSAAEAAGVILDGVRDERWRILVGNDARRLDQMVRADPEHIYEPATMQRVRAALREEREKTLAARAAGAPRSSVGARVPETETET